MLVTRDRRRIDEYLLYLKKEIDLLAHALGDGAALSNCIGEEERPRIFRRIRFVQLADIRSTVSQSIHPPSEAWKLIPAN